MPKTDATYIDCPGITTDGLYAHDMRDNCWSCAPFWARIPLCPVCQRKLTSTGYCRGCHLHYKLGEVSDAHVHD